MMVPADSKQNADGDSPTPLLPGSGSVRRRRRRSDAPPSSEAASETELAGDEVSSGSSSARNSEHDVNRGLSTPMKEILDAATVRDLPRYIFRAYEMTQDVRRLLKECADTDVVLVAADDEIPAHSIVLREHGGSLSEMVDAADAKGRRGDAARLQLPEVSGEVLLEVLRFVYTGTAPAAGRMPRVLLSAAHRVGLAELKARCAEVLVQRLDVHNVTETFELGDTHQEERLKQAAAVLFLEKAKEVYETEEWHQSLDLRPATAMRLVHIAVSKGSLNEGAMGTGTRIVHLIARIYMVAIVPVVGYILYATVRNKLRGNIGSNSGGNDTLADALNDTFLL